MKKVIFGMCLTLIVGLNVAVFSQPVDLGEAGQVTCYSTYTSNGSTTITKCNGCVEQSSVNTYTDSGRCRA